MRTSRQDRAAAHRTAWLFRIVCPLLVPAFLALCGAPGTAAAQGSLYEDDLAEAFPQGAEGGPGMPDADFVFVVPVDVTNLFDAVTAVKVQCRVAHTVEEEGSPGDRETRARGETTVPVENGAFQGDVWVGADYLQEALSEGRLEVDHYVCHFALVGPDGEVFLPLANPQWEGQYWRRPDPNEPFTGTVRGTIPGGEE